MNLNDELNLVKDFKNSGKYINEPGVFIVKITGYQTSESKKDYKGNPFIEFTVQDVESEKENTITFYRITGKESDTAREFKLKRLKEFLANANYNDTLNGEDAIKSVIGNRVKALFKQIEYVGKDKDNYNKPVIKTAIEYSFCAAEHNTIKGNQSYFFTPLKPAKMEQYKERLADWESEHKPSQAAATQGKPASDKGLDDDNSIGDTEGDDLPF